MAVSAAADGLIDTLLQIEGFDGILRSYPIQVHNFDSDMIENIEAQQKIMSDILKSLMEPPDLDDDDTVAKVFEEILDLDSVYDEFPEQFYLLLAKEEFLKCIVRYVCVQNIQVQQLCFCVLTKILNHCREEYVTQTCIHFLLGKKQLISKTKEILERHLKVYSDIINDPYKQSDQYISIITVVLNFLTLIYRKLQQEKRQSFMNEMIEELFLLTIKCVAMCMTEEDVVECCLELLQYFLQSDSSDVYQTFLQQSSYRILFDVLSNHPYEEPVVKHATNIFIIVFQKCVPTPYDKHILCTDEERLNLKASVGYFISESIVYIVEKFNFYEDHPTFLLLFLQIIEKITVYKSIAELLVEQSAIMLIVNGMKCHYKESKIQLSAIKTFENLSGVKEQDNTDSRWLAEIFAAMINHQDNIQVQEAACYALSSRVAANPELTKLIGEGDDHVLPLHMSVLAALNIHAGDIYVFRAACEAIFEMSSHSKELQQYLYTKGASASIIKEMKANMGEVEVHGSGCRALRSLAFNNQYQEELMFIEDILSVIGENMRTFTDVNVLKECIGLFVCLATDLPIVLRQCNAMKLPELTLRIATDYMEKTELVETALEAIALFSSSEEQQLQHIECIRSIRKILEHHLDNPSIQMKGCVIAQLINADLQFVVNQNVLAEILGILKNAMDKFENNSQVQIEGCIAIYLLFIHKGEMSNVLRFNALECNVQDILFNIIEYENEEDEAALYARDSLTELSSNQQYKDLLLQKACSGDYNKCVEFMISLGASLEARPRLPLGIAVSNGNKKLVELLLSYDSSNADKALGFCLDENNYEIAGVLLRYIGFEKESGNLIWSALNIKDLKPDLIYNTLTFQLENRNRNSLRTPKGRENEGPSRVSKGKVSYGSFLDISAGTPSKISPSRLSSSSFVSNLDIDMRERSSSESSLEEVGFTFGRKIKSISGPILPYNQDDPRLTRRGSDVEKHLIPCSPRDTDYWHYPRQPDASPMIGESAGNLLPPIERCVTPDLFGSRRRKLKSAVSECSLNSDLSVGRSRFYTHNNLETPQPKIMKPNSPHTPRNRAISCMNPPKLQTQNNEGIKMLDISCNQITNIAQFLTCPSNLIVDLLSQLQILHLNGNLLSEFSKECCKTLPTLKSLSLATNQLTCFPYEILEHQVLETLDVSNNLIADIDPNKVINTLSLQKLDLSYNKLSDFPVWVGNTLPRLSKLLLRGNQIREIPEKSLGFRSIKEINLSHNVISKISSAFFRSCFSLEKIDLSHNILETLPNYAPSTLSRLSQVKLGHNRLEERKPFYLPRFLLAIPSLTTVDLSSNRIAQLPDPQLWSARGLKELSLANNRIRKMNITKCSRNYWPNISRLNLSGNRIETIPPEIGGLDSLVSLDVSHNQITVLPDEIGLLKKLFELPLDGLKLKHDPASIKGRRPQDIVTYFGSKLKHAVPYRRIKLMLVGLGGRGKSSLLHQLANTKRPTHNVATVGIELRDWELKPPKSKNGKKPQTFTMNTWDFAGQEDFYSTHQYFLSSRALYLAVYDASRGTQELDNLRTWLLNIQASAPGAMVVLVGTHSDKIGKDGRGEYIKTLCNYINDFVKEPGFPSIQSKFIVNCMKETSAMEKLREAIYDIISNFKYEGQHIIEQSVPRCYVELEDLIRIEAGRMAAEKVLPIKKWDQLLKLSRDSKLIIDEEELKCALKFLKETGSIMNFSDPSGTTNNLYFIDPQWLCQMMARVVTIREINPYITPQGVLTKTDASKLFPRNVYPAEFLDRYFRLLRMFEIVLPLSEEEYLVTARVPQHSPQFIPELQERLGNDENVVTRRYIFPYIPNGFWARLITRILLYESEKLVTNLQPQREFWQKGIYIKWDNSRFFLIAVIPDVQNTFDIYVPENQEGFQLLGVAVDLIDNLIEEWYPGLTDTSYANTSTHIQRLAPCVSCRDGNDCYFFTVAECTAASYKSDMVECPDCGPRLIKSVAPDVVFADIDTSLILETLNIDYDMLTRSRGKKIGAGAFASVYKINVEGENFAAKVFIENGGTSANRLLRQEVDILTKLHHPCLISIVGVSLRPRMLLLEYAPLGNLEDTLKSGRGPLSRGMQHRMALQIVEGLTYLHDRGIVYRDLKPGNVLVFSLSMGMFINVKLSDYGISQWSSIMGLTAGKGTPGYQAPEVTQRNTNYDEKVDIFSFGVTFYEIVTGGHQPYGDIPFQSQLDAMVLDNKPMNSISKHGCPPWTDIENLIQQCLQPNPEHRPNATTIRDALLNANVVCLKREVAISRDQSVECTAIRRFTEDNRDKLEVWVGSGETEQSQISWFTLGVVKKQSVQGRIIKEGRILCMENHHNYIIVGTNRGYVIIFNADTKTRENTVKLKDAVLCMKVLPGKDQIVMGLACGDLMVCPVIKLIAGVDIDSNPITFDFDVQAGPIACMVITGNRLLCGYGEYALELRLESFRKTRIWKVGSKALNNVSSIAVSKTHIFVACRESCEIKVYENNKMFVDPKIIDCYEILKADDKGDQIGPRECRAISMSIVDRATLWIGCENGKIIILDAVKFSSGKPLNIISRNKTAVRSIDVSPRMSGTSASVITTGQGFKQWRKSGEANDDEETLDGYVLVWDAELPKQKKHMLTEHRKREEMAVQMACD